MKFNINDYKGNYAMHCKTQEEAQSFCEYLNGLGKKWCDGDSYVEDNGWNKYKSDTCYIFNSGYRRPVIGAINDGCTILEWSDFMKSTFTKANLKNGDVIQKRNGNVEIVCVDIGTLITKSGGFNLLDDVNDDLTGNHWSDMYDIVAVRRPKQPSDCRFDAFAFECGELVYDRNRKEVEEMTLEEVCKALGKEIKIVKEH